MWLCQLSFLDNVICCVLLWSSISNCLANYSTCFNQYDGQLHRLLIFYQSNLPWSIYALLLFHDPCFYVLNHTILHSINHLFLFCISFFTFLAISFFLIFLTSIEFVLLPFNILLEINNNSIILWLFCCLFNIPCVILCMTIYSKHTLYKSDPLCIF